MIAIFCGSREWTDAQAIKKVMSGLDPDGLTIVHGAQRGADLLSRDVAIELGASTISVPADWDAYGRAAGPVRNEQMKEILVQAGKRYEQPIRCCAFHMDPKLGAGTRDMVRRSRGANIKCYVYIGAPLEMIRASGDVLCKQCETPYYKHPEVISELDWEGRPFLQLACDGVAIKL